MSTPIVLADIIAAYDDLWTSWDAKNSAKSSLVDLGSRPVFPKVAISDASYNSILTSQGTWDTNYSHAINDLNVAIKSQIEDELSVLSLMFPDFDQTQLRIDTTSGFTLPGTAFSKAPAEWFAMTGLDNWDDADAFIGIKNSSFSNAPTETIIPGLYYIFAVDGSLTPNTIFPNTIPSSVSS